MGLRVIADLLHGRKQRAMVDGLTVKALASGGVHTVVGPALR